MYSIPVSTRPIQPMGPTARKAIAMFGTVLLGTGSVYEIDRAEVWRQHLQPRVPFILDAAETLNDTTERPDVRTVVEHIENIRSVLNPSVAELAALFDISRQAIYKWLSGDSTPEQDKIGRIVEMSRIADAFKAESVSRAGTLLKMKTFGGRSLMELIKSGRARNEHVAALINEAKAMEVSYNRSGLATSKSKPTRDWQSTISIPGSPERT